MQQISKMLDDETDVDTLVEHWTSAMIGIFDDMAPVKPVPKRKTRIPWMNEEIRMLKSNRDSIARRIKRTNNPTEEILEELRISKRKVTSNVKRAFKEYSKEMVCDNNYKGAWKIIKAATFTTADVVRTSMDLNTLNEYFAKVVTSDDTSEVVLPSGCDGEDCFQIGKVEQLETLKMLLQLKTNTATGSDDIPAFVLKKLAPAVTQHLTQIFNCSIHQNTFPSKWKEANISAIWKGKGSKTEAVNYRPISVLPVVGRLFEKIVATRLSDYVEKRGIIPNQQFGFRRKSSCELALASAINNWAKAVDQGRYVGTLLIDLSKAFDMVPHQRLILELLAVGLSGDSLQWFHSYLTNRRQRVIDRSHVTPWRPVSRSVPQGGSISPLLFNSHVRDLPESISVDTFQFADDITLSESDSSLSVVKDHLSSAFSEVENFCEDHGLIINAEKTQFMIIKVPNKKVPIDTELLIHGNSIKPLNKVKLLGVVLDQHLTFGPHIDTVVNKCHGLLGLLSRAAPYLPKELLRVAYCAMIRSHLEYSSLILDSASVANLRKLDTVQRMAARIISRATRRAHAAPLEKELKLESLQFRRRKHIVDVVSSILDNDCNPAFRGMFDRDHHGNAVNDETARLVFGKKRFSMHGKKIYNMQFSASQLF